MLNREKNRIVAEAFLAVEENNMGKDSRKKTAKKKRQDKKPLLAGYIILINTSVAGTRHAFNGTDSNQFLGISSYLYWGKTVNSEL